MSTMVWAEPLAKAGEGGKSGPVGLAIIVILCVVCYFLFKSMSKHMRRVREDFPVGAASHSRPEPPVDLVKQPSADSAAAPAAQSTETRPPDTE